MLRRMNRQRRPGFTLIELLVVIMIISILLGLILPALAASRQRRYVTLATSEVKQIAAAATAYFDQLHCYPPDTGSFGGPDGMSPAGPFTTGNSPEVAPPDPDAIFKYLGRKIIDKNTGVEYGPFLVLKTTYLKGPLNMTYVDPWGHPYRMDCIHSKIDAATGEVHVYGEPYPAGSTPENVAHKTVEVKVWSCGIDGDENDGSKAFTGKNGTKNGGTGGTENDDNICSWEEM